MPNRAEVICYIANGTEHNRQTPGMPAEYSLRQRRRRRKETAAERTNCHTATADDTKLLLHNSDFL